MLSQVNAKSALNFGIYNIEAEKCHLNLYEYSIFEQFFENR